MRCTSYCTASSYNIPELFKYLLDKGPTLLFQDVVHFEVKEGKKTKGDVFFFSYGAIVSWGLTELEEKACIDHVKKFENDSNKKTEIDELSYQYGDLIEIKEDVITLQNKSALTKLAVSHGIAQSVKLAIFEILIQKTIGLTKALPSELARKGKISLSRKQISKKIGELFIRRSFINLHLEILDVPDFFWDYPELEPFYRKSAHYLDVGKRGEILNKRLGVINELFGILSGELNHQHSSRLEWIIIVLIMIEVLLAVLNDVFNVWGG